MMLTRCPSCDTIFRITPEQLKTRQGRVRCGECRQVFNALDTLLDEMGPLPRPAPQEIPAAPVAVVASPPVASDAAMGPVTGADEERGIPDESPATTAEFPLPGRKAPEHAPDLPGSRGGSAGLPQNAIAPSDASDAGPASLPGAPAGLPEPPSLPPDPPMAAGPIPEAAPAKALGAPPPPPADGAFDPDASTFLAEEPPRRRIWPWVLGTLLALLALAGQATYRFRGELAVLHPELRRALAGACELLACDLPLPKQPALLGIESSDLHPDPENKARLLLSATLRNRAPYPQALPHLEVTLTDTGDLALVRKVMGPESYLPGRRADEGIAANADLPVSLVIDAASVPAAGYRLYIFYP